MIYEADCLDWMRKQPDDSVDIVITSPPYEKARSYSIDFKLSGQDWVDWMKERVLEMVRISKGLVAIVCEGQTRNYRWSATPALLMADLHRAGIALRKPPIYHRIGIPGSGGPDWLRNDFEFVICCTSGGKLPWSDNTACGHPPKWAPGGAMSNRLTDGTRVNQWGKIGTEAGMNGKSQRTRDGGRQKASRPSHVTMTAGEANEAKVQAMLDGKIQAYSVPKLANPGNTIQEKYTADEVAEMLSEASDVTHHVVGGGVMGSKLAHENEAPFPLTLAEFFVKSFCPPGGLCYDPFSGSGTTAHACVLHGRNFVGTDIRKSQVDLTQRRIEEACGK